MLYGGNTYPALGHALRDKGYRTLNIVCDRAQDWNQAETSPAYGFETLYDKTSFGASETLSDSVLFAESLSILKWTQEPFFSQIVTISTHAPNKAPSIPRLFPDTRPSRASWSTRWRLFIASTDSWAVFSIR